MRILITLFILAFYVMAQAEETKVPKLVEVDDIRSYHPDQKGLRDLTFDVVVPGITEHLNAEKIFGKLKEVLFRVYWVHHGGSHIEVIGLPEGFYERKEMLKGIVAPRLAFVVPPTLQSMVNGYSFVEGKSGSESVLRGEDRTNMSFTNRISLWFSSEGIMKKMVMSSPAGERTTELDKKTFAWSGGKYVVTSLKNKSVEGAQTITMTTNIKYSSVDGFGFPAMIESTTKQSLNLPQKNKETSNEREVTSSVIFKNYQVNKGEAAKRLVELSREGEKKRADEIKARINGSN